jgi:hypothetical protein
MKLKTCKSFNQKVTIATVSLLTLATVGGSNSVFADSTNTPDTSSVREITVHAYNGTKNNANTLGNNDGSPLTGIKAQSLSNVGFSAVKIVPASGYTVTTMDPSNSSTYNLVGSAVIGTTGADGTATLNIGTDSANDGYYLVTQTTSSDGITAAAPFIVQVPLNYTGTSPDGSWTYDVNVYPKLDASQYTNPDKTIGLNDGTNTDKQSSIFVGQNVTWNLATNFPTSMRIKNSNGSFTYGKAEFKDQLDSNLTYQSITFSTALQNTSTNSFSQITPLTLIADEDYTLSTTKGMVDIILTNTGIDKVLAALPAATPGNTSMFIPNITTMVSANYTFGQIGNSFIPNLTNAYGVNLNPNSNPSNPAIPTTPGGQTPDLYLGALTLKKVDSVSGTVLKGAVFGIATSATKASAGDFVQKGSDGTLYADKESVPNGVKTADYTQTTDTNGQATFVGLQLQDNTGVTTESSANTTYYISELSAPTGYNKPNGPFQVTAGITNPLNNLTNNLNGENIKLPFTGGQGIIGLIIIAGVAAGGSIIIRRRKTIDEG